MCHFRTYCPFAPNMKSYKVKTLYGITLPPGFIGGIWVTPSYEFCI
jgi:hypothetical protein